MTLKSEESAPTARGSCRENRSEGESGFALEGTHGGSHFYSLCGEAVAGGWWKKLT